MTERVVVVGAGQAGVQAAFSLRDEGFAGAIEIVGDEPGTPYQRPPLSKAFLLGKIDGEGLLLKSRRLYDEYGVVLGTGRRAVGLDRVQRRVRLADGQSLAYDHLILATGARLRMLDAPGAGLAGVMTLRTQADAERLRDRLPHVRRAVVVGAGFIGLEFAAVARAMGVEVTVVEIAPRPLARALSAEMAGFLRRRHELAGVRFVFEAGVQAICGGDAGVEHVELAQGETLPADLVLVGVGASPNTELAEAAGLEVRNGIVVDGQLRTSDPAIYAIGDCAAHPNRYCRTPLVRLESVQNATDQGRTVAAAILRRPVAYEALPWFWSDQGDLKLQIAGVGDGHDLTVVRGDPEQGRFSVFCFAEGRLVAVESMNSGPDHVMARRLMAANASITAAQAADLNAPLKAHLSTAAA